MVTQTAGVEACMATGQAGGLATHGPCATDTRAMATTTIPTATRGVHSTGGGGMCDLRSTPPHRSRMLQSGNDYVGPHGGQGGVGRRGAERLNGVGLSYDD